MEVINHNLEYKNKLESLCFTFRSAIEGLIACRKWKEDELAICLDGLAATFPKM